MVLFYKECVQRLLCAFFLQTAETECETLRYEI
jgi:hypothetical protein